MVARIVVRTVFFVFVFMSSLWGQQFETVTVKDGWSGYHIARQVTGHANNLLKATIYSAKDEDTTARFIDPNTGRINQEMFRTKLFVGMKIAFPMYLVITQTFEPEGKTLSQVCAENKSWDCLRLEINNHISSMRQPLTGSIRVPKVRQEQEPNKVQDLCTAPAVFPPDPVKLISLVFPYISFAIIALGIIAIATAILIIVCCRRRQAIAHNKYHIPDAAEFRDRLASYPFKIGSLTFLKILISILSDVVEWLRWRAENLAASLGSKVLDAKDWQYCLDMNNNLLTHLRRPLPNNLQKLDSYYRIFPISRMVKIKVWGLDNNPFPNLTSHGGDVEAAVLLAKGEWPAQNFRALRVSNTYSFSHRKLGVCFPYKMKG